MAVSRCASRFLPHRPADSQALSRPLRQTLAPITPIHCPPALDARMHSSVLRYEQQNSRTAEQRNVIVADAVKHPPPPSLSPWERARLRRTTLHRQKTPESNKGSGVWTLLPLCLKAIERIQTALETASHPPHYVHLTAELYTTFITKTHPLYPKNNRGSEVSLPCPCSKQ